MAVSAFWKHFHRNQVPEKQEVPQKQEDMYLRRVGCGEMVRYELKSYSTEKVEWVSMETDENGSPVQVRVPDSHICEYSRKHCFSMAGKTYQDLGHFLRNQDGEWGQDIYGRKVLCTKERYPCFDSSDYLYEDRYFRWYFIREGNAVSQLFAADDRDKIYVTEDVQNIEPWAWSRMKATGFCQLPENGED